MGHDILEASIQWITLRDDRLTGEVVLRSLVMLIAICLFSYIAVASFSFVRRCMAGASIRDLLANGCYEWIPGRGFHFVITGCLWIGRLGSGLAIIAAGLRALAQFDEDKTPEWTSAIIILAGTILAFTLARWLYHFHSETFIRVTRVKPPEVQVSVKSIQALRDAGDTSRIGTEKFPNDASPFFGVGLLARRLLRFLAISAWVLQAFIALPLTLKTEQPIAWLAFLVSWQTRMRFAYQEQILFIRSWDFPKAICLVGIYFGTALLLMLLNNNKHYLLFPFPRATILILLLASLIWLQVCSLGPIGEWDLAIVFASTFALLWMVGQRWNRDLILAASYKRTKRYLTPVRQLIQNAVKSFLERVQKDQYCRLPDLDAAQLSERITRGAHNIEEGDPFVTRFFGRFMRVARVATERCSTASLRFMTINRFTELGGYWPSVAPLRDPSVPVWDEVRFPIHAPKGFDTRRHSLPLPECYNPIYYCPPTETKTETYSETEYYTEWDSYSGANVSKNRTVEKTRQVQVTCSKCNGTGRLEFARYLITTWKTHRPTVVAPYMSMPELVEYAEEKLYFRQPLVECGAILSCGADLCVGDDVLQADMRTAGAHLGANTGDLCKQIVELTRDRYVYRADFIVGGLQAMNIRFAFLRSRTGWFFGKRPEFHFPSLPIGWATIATWLFLCPLALLVWLATAAFMFMALAWVLNGNLVVRPD